MLRGLATVNLYVDDLEAAKDWYAKLLGIEPYFSSQSVGLGPGYYEFRVGDYADELGLVDSRFEPGGRTERPGGAIVHWHVDDLRGTYEKLLAMGATEYDPPRERTGGFATASVVDPFGNIVGIMTNPHYLEVLRAFRPTAS